jgi:predicted GNAT family acetyltransferase
VAIMTTGTDIRVVDARERNRFEALDADGNLMGFADYLLFGGTIRFTHTETLPAFRGRGVAAAVATGSLDAARAAGLRVRPDCPYYKAFFEEHHEYDDLLEPGRRG